MNILRRALFTSDPIVAVAVAMAPIVILPRLYTLAGGTTPVVYSYFPPAAQMACAVLWSLQAIVALAGMHRALRAAAASCFVISTTIAARQVFYPLSAAAALWVACALVQGWLFMRCEIAHKMRMRT